MLIRIIGFIVGEIDGRTPGHQSEPLPDTHVAVTGPSDVRVYARSGSIQEEGQGELDASGMCEAIRIMCTNSALRTKQNDNNNNNGNDDHSQDADDVDYALGSDVVCYRNLQNTYFIIIIIIIIIIIKIIITRGATSNILEGSMLNWSEKQPLYRSISLNCQSLN